MAMTLEEFRATKRPAMMTDILHYTGAMAAVRGWNYSEALFIVETDRGFEFGWHQGADDTCPTLAEAEEGLFADYCHFAS
jgi:hypothetical protein